MTTQHFTRAMTVRIPETLVERLHRFCLQQSQERLEFVSQSRGIAILLEAHLGHTSSAPQAPRFLGEKVRAMTVRIPETLIPRLHRFCLQATPGRQSYSRGIAILLDENLPTTSRRRSKPARRSPPLRRPRRSAA